MHTRIAVICAFLGITLVMIAGLLGAFALVT